MPGRRPAPPAPADARSAPRAAAPIGVRVAPRYRTFWRRAVAQLVDGLIVGSVAAAIELVVFAPWSDGWTRLSAELIAVLLPTTYLIALHARYGRTIGKRSMGLRVVAHRGEGRIGWGRALLRDGMGYLFALWQFALLAPVLLAGPVGSATGTTFGIEVLVFGNAVWALLELGSMLASPQRRAVHDLIGGTVVVREGVGEPGGEERDGSGAGAPGTGALRA